MEPWLRDVSVLFVVTCEVSMTVDRGCDWIHTRALLFLHAVFESFDVVRIFAFFFGLG